MNRIRNHLCIANTIRRSPITLVKGLLLVTMIVAMTSCAPRYPLGIPEAEWHAMTAEQRLQAHEKQAELQQAAAERRAAEARAREEEAARQQAELIALRRQARYGERLQCVLEPVEARLFRSWRQVEPVALDVVVGAEQPFSLREPADRSTRRSSTGYATFDGQVLTICRDSQSNNPSLRHCLRLLGTFEDFRRGISQTVEAPDFLRGRLRCNLAPGEGMPPRMIIER